MAGEGTGPGNSEGGTEGSDHLADDLFAGNDGVDQDGGGKRAVVAEEGEASFDEPAVADFQIPRGDRVGVLGEGASVDVHTSVAGIDGFSWKSDDALDDERPRKRRRSSPRMDQPRKTRRRRGAGPLGAAPDGFTGFPAGVGDGAIR